MKIIRNKIIPFGYAKYINIFGVLFCKPKAKVSEIDINHESIHTAQMKELFYIGFYLIYVFEYIYKFIKYRYSEKAYRNISFEKEAYKFEGCLSYLKERERFAMWKL